MRIKLFIVSVLFSVSALAQTAKKIKPLCPEETLYRSFLFAKNNQYGKAKEVLYDVIANYPNCSEAYSRLADLSYRTNDTFYAVHYVKKLVEINEVRGLQTMLALNETMKEYGDEAMGMRMMQEVAAKALFKSEKQKIIDTLIEVATIRQNLVTSNLSAAPLKMSSYINGNTTQCFPSLTLDGKKLFFTKVINERNEDFFVSEIADSCSGWSMAQPLGSPPNTGGPDGASQISADGNYLFFTKCDQRSSNGYDGGGCDVFFCFKTNDGWSSPEKFKSTINSMSYEGQPCLNSLNNELYFVSDRKGGYGGKDIYKSKFINGLWQEPQNLGSKINTKYDDESPFIHADNETLYFVSRKYTGLGEQDIYVSKKIKDTVWQEAKNLGYPINTSANENSLCVTANGVDAIIASNRDNKQGTYSLYTVSLPKFAQANATHCVQGVLYDKLSDDILQNMEIEVYDSTHQLLQKCKTNAGDASFTFPLKAGHRYYYTVSDVVGYKKFTQEINLRSDNKLPPLISANAYIKIEDGIDTLYQSYFFGSENQDTTLYHLTHSFADWHTQSEDSVLLLANVIYNTYVDTSWLLSYSANDSLRQAYFDKQKQLQQQQQQEVLDYFNFYEKYIQQKQLPIKGFEISKKGEAWTGKERYKLALTAIEYY